MGQKLEDLVAHYPVELHDKGVWQLKATLIRGLHDDFDAFEFRFRSSSEVPAYPKAWFSFRGGEYALSLYGNKEALAFWQATGDSPCAYSMTFYNTHTLHHDLLFTLHKRSTS